MTPRFGSLLPALFVALLCKTGCLAATDSEVEFDYTDGPNGPQNWGNLTPEWELCKTGQWQSPVNVNKEDLEDEEYIGELKPSYQNGSAFVLINHHSITVNLTGNGGSLELVGVQYTLRNLHWHSPSEHTIDGVSFPLELHIVHQIPDGKYAVVSVLYEHGGEDKFLAQVIEKLNESEPTEIAVDVSSMELGDSYYHYNGSLTTPPCTERVTWIILQKTRTVATEQIQAILEADQGGNARPLQPLNGRQIYKYL